MVVVLNLLVIMAVLAEVDLRLTVVQGRVDKVSPGVMVFITELAAAAVVLVEMGVILHLLQALVLVLSAKSLLLLAQRFIMQQVVVAVFVREMLWH